MADNKKPDNEKPVPIVSNPNVVKRSSISGSIKSFLTDETGKIWRDSIKPGLKSIFLEFVAAALYGSGNYTPPNAGGRTNYATTGARRPVGERIIYSNGRQPVAPASQQEYNVVTAVGSDYNAYGFASLPAAQMALQKLRDVITRQGVVSVSYYYTDVLGIPCYYNEEYFGWTNLDGVYPTRDFVRNLYYLRLPKAMPIDRM